jgi:hypothetical protein
MSMPMLLETIGATRGSPPPDQPPGPPHSAMSARAASHRRHPPQSSGNLVVKVGNRYYSSRRPQQITRDGGDRAARFSPYSRSKTLAWDRWCSSIVRRVAEFALEDLVWSGNVIAQISNKPLSASNGALCGGKRVRPLIVFRGAMCVRIEPYYATWTRNRWQRRAFC